MFLLGASNIFAIPAARAQSTTPMQFEIASDSLANRFIRRSSNGGRYEIFATGLIEEDTADKLAQFVEANKIAAARVYFDSPGGSLIGGLKLGELIRALGFETGVRAQSYEYDVGPIAMCASACSYAFAGGVHRFLDDTMGTLGLHQFYTSGDSILNSNDTQVMSGVILSYLSKMGIDGRAFAIASVTDFTEMAWLSGSEAETIGLVDNGVMPTTAEIKLAEGQPYLKLEQTYNDFTSRVLITCKDSDKQILAGIVTTPENSNEQIGYFGNSYLEFDGTEYRLIADSKGADVEGSVIWLGRPLDAVGASLLRTSDTLGIWLHNGGPMRWGAYMNLKSVRPQIENFLRNCR